MTLKVEAVGKNTNGKTEYQTVFLSTLELLKLKYTKQRSIKTMAKNTKKNALESNKEARKRYNKANFKYQTISLKNEEMEEINNYCKDNGIPKNTLFRKAVMQYIGKPID